MHETDYRMPYLNRRFQFLYLVLIQLLFRSNACPNKTHFFKDCFHHIGFNLLSRLCIRPAVVAMSLASLDNCSFLLRFECKSFLLKISTWTPWSCFAPKFERFRTWRWLLIWPEPANPISTSSFWAFLLEGATISEFSLSKSLWLSPSDVDCPWRSPKSSERSFSGVWRTTSFEALFSEPLLPDSFLVLEET